MKKLFSLLALLCLFGMKGQTYTTLHNGAQGDIKIYIVSQGFTASSIALFNTWAGHFKDYLLSFEPYATQSSRFKIISVGYSGTTEHVPGAYFQFDNIPAGDLHYYIAVPPGHADYNQYMANECYTDFKTRISGLIPLTGWVDGKSYLIAVFNNNYYTGGGGEYTFASLYNYTGLLGSITSLKVAMHEFNHTFGILGDEYTASGTVPYVHDEFCNIVYDPPGTPLQIGPDTFTLFHNRNVSPTTTTANVPWEYLINLSTPGIGTFAGAIYSNSWYRPTNAACMMYNLYGSFCKVCQDLITERVHEHTCDNTVNVTEDFISRHQYIMHWRKAATTLNSTSDIGNKISVDFLSGDTVLLQDGFVALSGCDFLANIGDCDNIDLVNTYRPGTYKGDTNIPGANYGTTQLINHDPVIDSFIQNRLTMSPNPAIDFIDLSLAEGNIVGIRILSIEGKLLHNRQSTAGNNLRLDVSSLPKGTYLLELSDSFGQQHIRKFLKK